MGTIAALLNMDRATLTAALKPLERGGLVDVTVDRTDRRSRALALTRAGRSLLTAALPIWKRTHAEVERLRGGSDPDILRRDLRALS
jgi:DNA-binding MarR family transcriptional regulator